MAHQQGIVEILGQVVTKQTIQGAETFEFSSNDFFLRKTKNATAVAKNLDFLGVGHYHVSNIFLMMWRTRVVISLRR